MINLVSRFKASLFIRNSFKLMLGTVLSQLIIILISPVLTRIYAPADFGLFALFSSIGLMLSSVAAARYDMAVVIASDKKESFSLMQLSLILTLLFSILMFIIVAVWNTEICNVLGNQAISFWLYFIPVSILMISVNSIFIGWYNREKEYNVIATNRILRTGSMTFLNLIIGYVRKSGLGLLVGQLTGDLISSLTLIIRFLKRNGHTEFRESRKDMMASAKKYSDFPVYSMPTILLDTASKQIPVLLIARWFSDSMTGLYFFALRILSIPTAFFGQAVSQTFFPEFNEKIALGNKEAKQFILKIWFTLFAIAFIPCLILFFWGEPVFGFVFGAEWSFSGKIAAMLAPYILLQFVSSPTSSAYTVMRMQHLSLVFGILVMIYRPLAFFAGYYYGDFLLGIKILTICEMIEIMIYNLIIYLKL